MKKFFLIILFYALCPLPYALATDIADLSIADQMALAQIPKLEQELSDKQAQLKSCQSDIKKYKIAGISTVAATGVGIAANAYLYNKLSKMSGGGASGGGIDTRSAKKKCESTVADWCDAHPTDPDCKEYFESGC